MQLLLPPNNAIVQGLKLHQSTLNLVKHQQLSHGKDLILFALLDQFKFLILLGTHSSAPQQHLELGNIASITSFTCQKINK